MATRSKPLAIVAASVVAAVVLAACGSQGVKLADSDPNYHGAVLFNERCSGCHTMASAGAQGSATKIKDRERVDGPNFNTRKETVAQVLYAIRNGGFSGAIMPENLVTGREADQIAEFLAQYSGKQKATP